MNIEYPEGFNTKQPVLITKIKEDKDTIILVGEKLLPGEIDKLPFKKNFLSSTPLTNLQAISYVMYLMMWTAKNNCGIVVIENITFDIERLSLR